MAVGIRVFLDFSKAFVRLLLEPFVTLGHLFISSTISPMLLIQR